MKLKIQKLELPFDKSSESRLTQAAMFTSKSKDGENKLSIWGLPEKPDELFSLISRIFNDA